MLAEAASCVRSALCNRAFSSLDRQRAILSRHVIARLGGSSVGRVFLLLLRLSQFTRPLPMNSFLTPRRCTRRRSFNLRQIHSWWRITKAWMIGTYGFPLQRRPQISITSNRCAKDSNRPWLCKNSRQDRIGRNMIKKLRSTRSVGP